LTVRKCVKYFIFNRLEEKHRKDQTNITVI